jgi:hypothetical protein
MIMQFKDMVLDIAMSECHTHSQHSCGIDSNYAKRSETKLNLQIVLQDTCKVILQLRSSEIGQDLLPIRWILQNKPHEIHKD